MGTITVSNLGKAYKQYPTRWSRLAEWLIPFSKSRHSLKWVLQDINFTINAGEAVGIVGVNGAGKSTLLKMITGTTQPTTGSVQINGRVAALLELGMGFHPDFTGRQNVLMAGQLLGYSIQEINERMPEIEAFAEIGEYIDRPVRIYSSGMQVRLAFSVATAVRPDILIVDEALAVGDAAFQRKCFRRIEEFLTEGTTLLFVSHSTETIKKICSKALYISQGNLKEFEAAKKVCDLYEKDLFGSERTIETKKQSAKLGIIDQSLTSDCEMTYGDGRAEIQSIWMEDSSGERSNVFATGIEIAVCYRVSVQQALDSLIFAMMIKTREGICVYGTDSKHLDCSVDQAAANEFINVKFSLQNNLAPGIYYLNCGLRDEAHTFIHRRIDTLVFRVIADKATTAITGVSELAARLIIDKSS